MLLRVVTAKVLLLCVILLLLHAISTCHHPPSHRPQSCLLLLHVIELSVTAPTQTSSVLHMGFLGSHVRQNQLFAAYPAYYTYGCQWHPPPAGAGYHAGYRWYCSKPIGGTP